MAADLVGIEITQGDVSQFEPQQPSIEVTTSVAGSHCTNAANRHDVDGSGELGQDDAEAIIRDLNKNGARELTEPCNPNGRFQPDVNGDGFVSPIDVLLVVN